MTYRACRLERGFTLIELIMVIVLIGVLAVFAAPRFNSSDSLARGFHDETLALLRYAQKTAIAQRRTVCVAFSTTSATLTIAANPADSTCPGGNLTGPRGETPARVTARSGMNYNPQPSDFSFDGLGQPSAGRSIKVRNNSTNINPTITVEATTGYVHD